MSQRQDLLPLFRTAVLDRDWIRFEQILSQCSETWLDQHANSLLHYLVVQNYPEDRDKVVQRQLITTLLPHGLHKDMASIFKRACLYGELMVIKMLLAGGCEVNLYLLTHVLKLLQDCDYDNEIYLKAKFKLLLGYYQFDLTWLWTDADPVEHTEQGSVTGETFRLDLLFLDDNDLTRQVLIHSFNSTDERIFTTDMIALINRSFNAKALLTELALIDPTLD